ncbi:MAG: RHS repeat protein, partial [Acidimicrobiales bacterium]|nr:RHS repeat protein [Acidimicrobiales bacterium]
MTIRTETEVDHFGNTTRKADLGVIAGGPLGYDDERITTTTYAHNLDRWIIGLPVEVNTTDEGGAFVSRTRNEYDNQAGGVGNRGLLTAEEAFTDAGTGLITRYLYDAFGNVTTVRDPEYGSGGHERVYGYDATFHTYVETETIKVGNGSSDLVASATYDKGGGVITSSTDFNGNVSTYQYDSFFRLVGIVKPGDTPGAPTQVFEYRPGDPVRKLVYSYSPVGDLALSVSAADLVVSEVGVKSREEAGGGTFDIVQITDGMGHKLGTIEEGATAGQWVYKDVKRYTSRGQERDSYLPFFGGSPSFTQPPPDGARVTCFLDALGRKVSCINPPETAGGARTATRTDYLPLVTVLFDEEDNDPGSDHFNTPHVQYQDGLERLVGVDESIDGETWPTRYAYDLLDNLTGIVDSQGNRKAMSYDGLSRLTFMDDPDRGIMSYTYDDASNLIQTEDAKGQVIVMTYDGANRILSEDYLDAAGIAPDVSYFYDEPVTVPAGDGSMATSSQVKGKLSRVIDLSGAEVFSYDARGRTAWKIKQVPDPFTGVLSSYQFAFGYDSLDRLRTLGYPDGDSVGYTYNARNLPESIVGGPGGHIISAMSYIASGQLASIAYGNGVNTAYAYDPRLRLRKLDTVGPGGAGLIDFDYTFDGASNITRIDDNRAAVPVSDPRHNTQVFAYDDLYRLTGVQYPSLGEGIAYSYDRIGNMLGKTSGIVHDENDLSITNLGAMSYGG